MSLREALTYLEGLGFDHLYPSAAAAHRAPETAPVAAESLAETPLVAQSGSRVQRLDEVASQARECRACSLCEGRNTVVFGSGDPGARLMFVGEGPGAEEDRQGLPFVGAAGELLTKIIAAIGLRRDQVYIANMVKCRPPENRDPHPDELAACRSYVEQQIDLVQPVVLVTLGRIAAQALLETTESLGRLRGTWHEVRGVMTRTTYHPAALLRYPKYKRPTWEDMQVVRDRLAELA